MFNNVGRKIKTLAIIVACLGVVVGTIWLIISAQAYFKGAEYIQYMYDFEYTILQEAGARAYAGKTGIMWSIILIASSVISIWPLYGFGQLIENSDKIVALLSKPPENSDVEIEKELPEI